MIHELQDVPLECILPSPIAYDALLCRKYRTEKLIMSKCLRKCMDLETIISVLGLLGVGGIIGSYVQFMFSQKGETEKRIQSLKVRTYKSVLVFMRLVLNPKMIDQFDVSRDDPLLTKLENLHDVSYYARRRLVEFYYASMLFSPNEVMTAIREFIDNPSEDNFMKSANAMRKDSWKKKTKENFQSLLLEKGSK